MMKRQYRIIQDGDIYKLQLRERILPFLPFTSWFYLNGWKSFSELTEIAANHANPPKVEVLWETEIEVKS